MSKEDKLLFMLREICLKISTAENSSEHVAELKKQLAKGRYFEQQSFKELIEIAGNAKLSIPKATEILKLLKTILDEATGNKDFLISTLYNYIAGNKYRAYLIEELVALCSFNAMPECKNPETVLYLADKLLIVTETKKQRTSLYKNYESFLRLHGTDSKLCVNLMDSLLRATSKFVKEKKWSEIIELLQATLLKGVSNQSFVVNSDDVFSEVLKILTWLVEYGHDQAGVISFALVFAEKLAHEPTTNKKYRICYKILQKALEMCCAGAITEAGIKDLHSNHFSSEETNDVRLQGATMFVAQLFKQNVKLFEMTADCFAAYYHLSIRFFHVFKFIKNKEGVLACCSDIKRHQIHSAIGTIMSFACTLVKSEKFVPSLTSKVEYHVKYDADITLGLKCKSKHTGMLKASGSIYNYIYQFITRPMLLEENIQHIDVCMKTFFKIYSQIPQEVKDTMIDMSPILNAYGKPLDKSTALIHANGIASNMAYKRNCASEEKKTTKAYKLNMMRLIVLLREATRLLGFESATDFIDSDSFKDSKFSGNACKLFEGQKVEFMVLEMSALFRYDGGENTKTVEKLFMRIVENTSDVQLLTNVSQAITDASLKEMNSDRHVDRFKNVVKILEKEESLLRKKNHPSFEVSLALALNNYSIYFMLYNAVPRSDVKQTVSQLIEKLQLREEIEQLKYLNESLRHFTDVVCHLMKHKEDSEKVLSMTRMISILRNMATQYFMRGVKYKDFEAFTVLWNLLKVESESAKDIMNIATFFLDHHRSLIDTTGNYLRMSKKLKPLTIENILERTNETLDSEYIPTFEKQTEPTQAFILSYLLSLWVFLATKKKSSAFKRWEQFKSLWETWNAPKEAPCRAIIHAKVYFCIMEINLKCCNRSADNFLSLGCTRLLSVSGCDYEFSCQFHQIFYRYNIEAINHSMNRMVDMDHYELAIQSLLYATAKNRFCLKTIELLSLSILRYLNMEKLDRAKAQLKEITKLLGISQEILVESPFKVEPLAASLDFDFQVENIRKCAVTPSSPIQCEISTIYEDNSDLLSRQLKHFVHKLDCECEICKTPQLKFNTFQVGCHYSRLMWLTRRWSTSAEFNTFALNQWRKVCDELRRVKDSEFLMINKINFAVFSIRWLFQCEDTLVRLKRYDEVEKIHIEVELICTDNIPDHECFKQILYCRKESLRHLMEPPEIEEKATEALSFVEFLKQKPKANKYSRSSPAVGTSTVSPVVYIDLSDDEDVAPPKPVPKTARKPKTSPSDPVQRSAKPKEKKTRGKPNESKDESSSSSTSLRPTRRRI